MTPEISSKLSKITLPKNFSIRVDGLSVISYLIRRMGQVYFGKTKYVSGNQVPPIATFMSTVLPENIHVIMLQRQIVQLPTGDRYEDVRHKSKSLAGE